VRRVLVTGASRGLGQAIAIAFAADGAHVWVGYARNTKAADATVETTQIAPTILRLLGLSTRELQAVRAEGTRSLP